MFSQAIIRCSTPPYSSPTWIVPTKVHASEKRKWRVAMDYRKLNEITVDDKFPKPDDMLDKLGRSIDFTTLCLAKAFQQVKVKEEDTRKTVFFTNRGLYELVQIPFGLKNAPPTFQSIYIVLRGKILLCLYGWCDSFQYNPSRKLIITRRNIQTI